MQVQSLTLLSRSGSRCCHELWCRSQMQLRPCVAVAVAIDVIRTLAWELLYAAGTAIKSKKKKNKQTKQLAYITLNVFCASVENTNDVSITNPPHCQKQSCQIEFGLQLSSLPFNLVGLGFTLG